MNSSQSKIANRKSQMTLMGWLGRQIGHVKKAIQTPVEPTTLYRQQTIDEATLPDNPELKLRRTTIDEVIRENRKNNS